jgi:hypothetical protein
VPHVLSFAAAVLFGVVLAGGTGAVFLILIERLYRMWRR